MNKQQLASKIWESANKMRSKIEANEYKDYILGFMFYKFLSDKEEIDSLIARHDEDPGQRILQKRLAEEITVMVHGKEEYEKAKPLTFSEYGIPIGATLEYCNRGNENSGKTCTVIDEKTVEFEGKSWSLSGLAKEFCHSKYGVQGPKYFKYNGEWLTEIRKRLGI